MSSGEHRLPSDTLRLDQVEIAEAMAKAEREADVADPVPDEPTTQLECPSCAALVAPECPCCKGLGIVTVEKWRQWRIDHPTRRP